jgi:hypothetical protein
MKKTFQAAIDERSKMAAESKQVILTVTGVRSGTPTGLPAAGQVNDLHNHFWEFGSLHLDPAVVSRTTYANPMFASPDATVKPSSGIDPLLGFHLSAAYAPLASDPARARSPKETTLGDIVAAAKAEFHRWSTTLRSRAREHLTLRFFAGYALAFCHTLQHRRVTGSSRTASWYRSWHNTTDPLVLVEDDYSAEGTAPVSFNVIGTSNLLDQLGGLNLLAATSPLLNNDASSSLYTETMGKREKALHEHPLSELVGGDLGTVSLLLRLFPVEYWTDTSPSSIGDISYSASP